MGVGKTEQIEKWFRNRSGYIKNGDTKSVKRMKNKLERRRAKRDPECQPQYGKYSGWMY